MGTAVNTIRMGDLVSTIGSLGFATEYFRLFKDVLNVEHCTVFAFRENSRPAALITECTQLDMQQSVRRLAHEYVAGAFRKDPNIRHRVSASTPVVYTLRAADLCDSEYRHQFYDEPELAHELILLGSVQGTLFYSSFYRCCSQPEFGRDEMESVQQLAYFAIKALHRHVELQSAVPATTSSAPLLPAVEQSCRSRSQAFEHLRDVLLADRKRLSRREAEVCAAIVLGYSTVAIGLNLGISPNTVATHRKRAYSKLGISSQNELFSQYFQRVAQFARG